MARGRYRKAMRTTARGRRNRFHKRKSKRMSNTYKVSRGGVRL